MGRRIADIIDAQVQRGLSKPQGLGFSRAGGQRFTATKRTRPSSLVRRHRDAAGAPFLSMALVTKPFEDEIKRITSQLLPAQASMVMRAIMLDLLARVARRTPVDTGLARNTWITARGTVASFKKPAGMTFHGVLASSISSTAGLGGTAGNTAGGADAAKHVQVSGSMAASGPLVSPRRNAGGAAVGDIGFTVRNNLPYILPLEYGWSGQAPLGMARVSMAELTGLAPAQMGKMFRAQWLERMQAASRAARPIAQRFGKRGQRTRRTRALGVTV